jgi:hypothetical protein
MHPHSDIVRRKPPRDPQVIAAELLSLRLDKPESGGKAVPVTYEQKLQGAMAFCDRIDDAAKLAQEYQMAHPGERIKSFTRAVIGVRNGLPLEARDRTAIGGGLEINAALIHSSKDSQGFARERIHPKPGSDVAKFQEFLFLAARDEEASLSRREWDDHQNSMAASSYYAARAAERALTERAEHLIAELAQSLNIPLRGTQRE